MDTQCSGGGKERQFVARCGALLEDLGLAGAFNVVGT